MVHNILFTYSEQLLILNTHIGYCIAWLRLILRVVWPKGFTHPISDIFLEYVQCFDIILQVNPKFPTRAGPFPEPTSSLFVLRWITWAGGALLGDIIPITQIHTFADLVPRFGSNADVQLMKQTSIEYSTKLYFDKETYYALTLL